MQRIMMAITTTLMMMTRMQMTMMVTATTHVVDAEGDGEDNEGN